MVKIVVDTGSDVTREVIEGDGCVLDVVPINLQIGDRLYVDDDSLDKNKFLDDMDASPSAVKTAAPAPAVYIDMYSGSEEAVFVVPLSSKLSASYASAITAMRMYMEECGNISKKFIHVFDSMSASSGQNLVAMKVAELVKKGVSYTEIIEQVDKFIKNMKTYFLLDKFDHLVKSGRMNSYVAKIAAILNIKPVCGAADGMPTMIEKALGYNKAVIKLIDRIKSEAPDHANRIVSISHTACLEKAIAFKEELLKRIPVKAVYIFEAKGCISVYANRGGFVVAI